MKIFLNGLAFFALCVNPAWAEHPEGHSLKHGKPPTIAADNGSKVAPAENELIVQVSGVVCSFCAYGLQKKLSALEFVETSRYKKGVLTNIEKQLVTIAVKPGVVPQIEVLRSSILAAGYEPIRLYRRGADGEVETIDFESTDE